MESNVSLLCVIDYRLYAGIITKNMISKTFWPARPDSHPALAGLYSY